MDDLGRQLVAGLTPRHSPNETLFIERVFNGWIVKYHKAPFTDEVRVFNSSADLVDYVRKELVQEFDKPVSELPLEQAGLLPE